MTSPPCRLANASDGGAASRLVMRSLTVDTLPGWTSDAISKLLAKASPGALSEEIVAADLALVACHHQAVAGFLLAKRLRFLNLLVVEPSLQRRGIGSRLVRCMLDRLNEVAPDVSVVEVNATEYSMSFYRRLGFYPLSEFITFEGCRFARLGYWRTNPMLSNSGC